MPSFASLPFSQSLFSHIRKEPLDEKSWFLVSDPINHIREGYPLKLCCREVRFCQALDLNLQ